MGNYYSDYYLDQISKVWPGVCPEQKKIAVGNTGKTRGKLRKKDNAKMPIVFSEDYGKINNV